jgi:hypothetical protein
MIQKHNPTDGVQWEREEAPAQPLQRGDPPGARVVRIAEHCPEST